MKMEMTSVRRQLYILSTTFCVHEGKKERKCWQHFSMHSCFLWRPSFSDVVIHSLNGRWVSFTCLHCMFCTHAGIFAHRKITIRTKGELLFRRRMSKSVIAFPFDVFFILNLQWRAKEKMKYHFIRKRIRLFSLHWLYLAFNSLVEFINKTTLNIIQTGLSIPTDVFPSTLLKFDVIFETRNKIIFRSYFFLIFEIEF